MLSITSDSAIAGGSSRPCRGQEVWASGPDTEMRCEVLMVVRCRSVRVCSTTDPVGHWTDV
jgi:hypothetical protein